MFSFMHVISAISECHVTIYIDSRVPFTTTSWVVGIKLHTMIMQRRLEVALFSGSSLLGGESLGTRLGRTLVAHKVAISSM